MKTIHRINFDPVEHRYTYAGNDPMYFDIEFLSCTTFIGKFKNHYNKEYWAYYKSIKDYSLSISDANWDRVKKMAGGWDSVVLYYFTNLDKIAYSVQLNINNRVLGYLSLWNDQSLIANIKGSAVHDELEVDFLIANGFIKENDYYKVCREEYFYLRGLKEGKESYPELTIFNLENALCGKVDRVDRDGIFLDITDYKTSIDIPREGFMGARMKVLDVPDAKYFHYLIQMSLYGWMLEQFGYRVRSLTLEHLICESRESRVIKEIKQIPMEYRPDLVEKMLPYRYKTPE